MKLSDIPTKGPELFPDTSWSVTSNEDKSFPLWIIRATLTATSMYAISDMVVQNAIGAEGLIDHVVDRVGGKLEKLIDERSRAAKEWRETAMRYRDQLRGGPFSAAWGPL